MESYSYFAEVYDDLTKNVDYPKMADYLLEISNKHNHKLGLTLDLACGTGSLTLILKKLGVDIFGVDASSDMLSVANEKAINQELNILFLCQKMQKLDLYGTVDTVFCTLDSINHITSKSELLKSLKRINLFLNDNGYFIFDCNTTYKHEHILGNNTFVYDIENVYCVWQNRFNKNNNIVDITLDFFKKIKNDTYERHTENFCERAYSIDEMTQIIGESGLKLIAVYEHMKFKDPKEKSDRITYITKKY